MHVHVLSINFISCDSICGKLRLYHSLYPTLILNEQIQFEREYAKDALTRQEFLHRIVKYFELLR